MAQAYSYGDILRDARERSGIDLASMSRKLHIRPDILAAIENADFDVMPARGYAKNMTRAYARALGLDEQQISNMFLDEIHYFESGSHRASSQSSRSRPYLAPRRNRGDSAEVGGFRQSRLARPSRDHIASYPRNARRSDAQGGRGYADDPQSGRRGAQSGQSNRSHRDSRSQGFLRRGNRPSRVAQGLGSIVSSFGVGRGRGEVKLPRSYSTIGSTPPYAQNTQQARSRFGLQNMNMPVLIGIAIVAILLVLILVVVLNGGKQAADDVPDIPISGLTDTSSPEEGNQAEDVKMAPESATFTYEVLSDKQAWITIHENGSDDPTFAGIVEGPDSQTYNVTDTLEFETAVPSAVKLTVDGEEVELQKNKNNGQYSYTVDFNEILANWEDGNKERGGSSSSSSGSKKSSSGSDSSASRRSSSSSSGN